MVIALLLMAQGIVGPLLPGDLRKRAPAPALPCPPSVEDGEITVCARRDGQRLQPLPEPVSSDRDPLAFRLPGGGQGRVRAIQSNLPGASGQGAAVTLTMPFGHGK